MPPPTHIDVFGNVLYHVDDLLLFIELQALLREIAKAHGVANIKASAIKRFLPKEHADKGGLSCTVITHDTHLFKARKVIVEVLQDYLVAKGL